MIRFASRWPVALLGLLALALGAAPVPEAEARVLVKRLPDQHYTVRGRTREDIGRALRDHMVRFISEESELAAALTYGTLDFRYRYKVNGAGALVIDDAEVTLTLRYVYPKWVSRDYAAPEVVQDWDTLMAHLVVHEEQGHGVIWKEGAKALEQDLLALPPQPDRAALEARLNQVLAAAMGVIDQRHQAFDLLEKNRFAFRPFAWR